MRGRKDKAAAAAAAPPSSSSEEDVDVNVGAAASESSEEEGLLPARGPGSQGQLPSGRNEDVAVERVLCCNVIQGDQGEAGLFRHPIFAYDEKLSWPPSEWRSLSCWHCAQPLEAPPVPVASAYEAAAGLFRVTGVFCAWPCGKAHLLETCGFAAGEAMLLLESMARDVFGYKGPPIPRAPPRHRLRAFGGDLEPGDFRRVSEEQWCTLRPPLLSRPEVYERLTSSTGDGWSVRGTRAQGGSSSSGAAPAPGPSLYSSFLEARSAQAPPPPLERSEPGVGAGAVCNLTTFIRKR